MNKSLVKDYLELIGSDKTDIQMREDILGKLLSDKGFVKILGDLIDDPTESVQSQAVFLLFTIDPQDLFVKLLGKMNSKSELIRIAACGGLSRSSYRDIAIEIPFLESVLKTDPSPAVRTQAIHALGDSFSKEAIPLLEWVGNNDKDVDYEETPLSDLAKYAISQIELKWLDDYHSQI